MIDTLSAEFRTITERLGDIRKNDMAAHEGDDAFVARVLPVARDLAQYFQLKADDFGDHQEGRTSDARYFKEILRQAVPEERKSRAGSEVIIRDRAAATLASLRLKPVTLPKILSQDQFALSDAIVKALLPSLKS